MNGNFKAFWIGFVEGAKETPRGFFAPFSAACRWLYRVTNEALRNDPNPTTRLERDLVPSRREEHGSYQAAASAIERAHQTLGDMCMMAFDTMERLDPNLAAAAVHTLGSRRAAAQWAATPLRELNDQSVYEAMSLGDRDRVTKLVDALAPGRG